jgi:hypothetical protein
VTQTTHDSPINQSPRLGSVPYQCRPDVYRNGKHHKHFRLRTPHCSTLPYAILRYASQARNSIQPEHVSPLADSAQCPINAEQTYMSLPHNEDPPSPARSCHVYIITLNPAMNRRCQIRHSRLRHAMLRPERGAPMDRLLGSARVPYRHRFYKLS